MGYSPWGRKMSEQLTFHHTSPPFSSAFCYLQSMRKYGGIRLKAYQLLYDPSIHRNFHLFIPFSYQLEPARLLRYRYTWVENIFYSLQNVKPINIFLQFFRELRVCGHADLDGLYPACMLSHFSCIRFFVTLWTLALQAPLSVGFSRQEYWSGLPCPPPRELPVSYSCSLIPYSLQIWDSALYCDPHNLK